MCVGKCGWWGGMSARVEVDECVGGGGCVGVRNENVPWNGDWEWRLGMETGNEDWEWRLNGDWEWTVNGDWEW